VALPPGPGIPVPVPDELILGEVSIPTRAELGRYWVGGRSGTTGEAAGRLEEVVPDTFPAIDRVFFGVRKPVPIRTVSPIYPAMAERAGLEGQVVVRVLVDALGRVRDAVIARCSAPGIGFEESAREALMKWVFTPAVQNDHPVAVWINVPVRFVTD